ncbi:hypothetical protein [Actinoplanes utahensis]|uniref:hypothetical protein n=1 Tax=Actinoplanes utahensis TaxID=1869 RepID=UPI00068A902A|nr:hypothetical protein [Actinoplanes utahensis]GIF29753.1 hypothetical protein Aut01nite_27390 [Actinoplanes utahensis]
MEISARARSGSAIDRLVSHPRLPLIAGREADRSAVQVRDGLLRELAVLGAGSPPYGDLFHRMTPEVAWHPHEAMLAVSDADGIALWTPEGVTPVPGIAQDPHGCRALAFSPDGRTLWADGWDCSSALDLASGTVATAAGWDTGVTAPPGGGLVSTLISEQAETLVVFATAGTDRPAVMRPLRRALHLDVDDYRPPDFSADGRHFAISGNAYDNTLEVFAFPSLTRVAALALGEPHPGSCSPLEDAWVEQMQTWARPAATFGSVPGVLWIGTPAGILIEYRVDGGRLIEHPVATSAVTALTATATGHLVVALGDGDLMLVREPPGPPASGAEEVAAAFGRATEHAPDETDEDDEDPYGGRFDFAGAGALPWTRVRASGNVVGGR